MKRLLCWLPLLAVFACQEPSTPIEKYKAAVRKGIMTSDRYDDLLLGFALGMPRQAFLDTCTQLNKEQLITMSNSGLRVRYNLMDELKRPAQLVLGPEFTDSDPPRIGQMNLKFTYDDWAPWNRAATADSLLPDVVHFLEERFGGEWLVLEHPQLGPIHTSVTGNRRLAVWKDDFAYINATVTDLKAFPERPLGPHH